MKLSTLLSSSLPLLLLAPSVSGISYCPSIPADDTTQEALFSVFIDVFYNTKDVQTAFTTFVNKNYIQHNPSALSGRQAALDFLTPVLPFVHFTIIHQGFYNGTGYVHYREDIPGMASQAVVDIFRLNGTYIMEHWDVIQT